MVAETQGNDSQRRWRDNLRSHDQGGQGTIHFWSVLVACKQGVIESPFQPPAQRLPNKPHGLNVFADYDDIVFLSSLNPTTDHFRFLKEPRD